MSYLTSRADILHHAKQMAQQYQAQGLTLTVRQLYYQFVARGLLPSGQNQYKKVGDTLAKARKAGKFDLELIEDRTRTMHPGSYTRNDHDPEAALPQAAEWVRNMPNFFLARDRWYEQPIHVSVWVEKEALAGVFEPTCRDLGVSWMACKGCPSVSALWEWTKAAGNAHWAMDMQRRYNYPNMPTVTENHDGEAARCVILYFGDHDPTGFMIPRTAQDALNDLMDVSNKPMDIRVKRVALNMDQVQQYNPPPFPGKTTDTRFKKYVKEHNTTEAWELDALDPPLLRAMIQNEVNALFDEDIYEHHQEQIGEARRQMLDMMRDPDWIAAALGGE